ncbi:MAG: hypothetical protein ACYCSG_01895 [Thermoplasmataceae archaeon]
MKIKKIYIVLVIIIITTVATLPVYQKWEGNNNSSTPPSPITLIGPSTTGFKFLYQVDSILGSNCFHFNLPEKHISCILLLIFSNSTSSGNCITVYNSTHCYVANFQLHSERCVQAEEPYNTSDIYPGNWSVSINFASPTGNGNYHFLVYYKEEVN